MRTVIHIRYCKYMYYSIYPMFGVFRWKMFKIWYYVQKPVHRYTYGGLYKTICVRHTN